MLDRSTVPIGRHLASAVEQRMKSVEAESGSLPDSAGRPRLDQGEEEAMPIPADPIIIFLGGMFLILLLAAHITAEIIWPLVLAFALSLRSWRNTIRANTSDNEDHLRPCATIGGVCPLLGRLNRFADVTSRAD
jgi:hypothetical protein